MGGTAKASILPSAPPLPPYYPPPLPVEQPYPHHHATPVPPVVVGPQYCVGHAVDLVIVRKWLSPTRDFVVRDVYKNVLFRSKSKILTLHGKRLLCDASGQPVVTLRRKKMLRAHSRWKVYRGNSSKGRDLAFSAKTSSSTSDQLKTKLNVHLAHRASQDVVCDYWVEGSLTKESCIVYYVGDNSQINIAAQMQKKDDVQSRVLGKDKFMVRVSPNVDYAFVVGLILILDAIPNATTA